MASVYRRKYRRPDGRSAECATWTVEAKIGDTFRRFPGFTDRRASEELGRKIERLAAMRICGEQPDAAMSQWLNGLTAKLRERLAACGLLSGTAVAARTPLTQHLADYQQALLDGAASPKQKGPATRKHADLIGFRVSAILEGIGASFHHEITTERVGRYLATRKAAGFAVQTCNNYIKDGKAFFNWMIRTNRAAKNPIAGISKQQITARARKHVRRALEVAEAVVLLATARSGELSYGMTGEERYWLYRLALETALRSGELRALHDANFELDDAEPFVWLPGDDTKNRESAEIPLRPDTASEFRTYLATRDAELPVFPMPRGDYVVRMLRADLERAGIPYETGSGVADFHALRGICLSWLAAAGVPFKTLQTFARHSTPTLTMNVYAKTLHGSLADAAGRLPELAQPAASVLAATGTDSATGGRTGGNVVPGSAIRGTVKRVQPAAMGCNMRPTADRGVGVSAFLVGAAAFKAVERLYKQSLVGSIPIHSRTFGFAALRCFALF